MNVDLEPWKAIGIIAGAIVGIAAATAVLWKGCRSMRHTGLRISKAIYLLVGREGNEELGIAPVLGIEAQFALLKAGQDHANWHLGNGGPIPMHQRLSEAIAETREARAEVAALKTIVDRRLAEQNTKHRRRSTDPR